MNDLLAKLAELISIVPDEKLKVLFVQLYARLEVAETAAKNVEVRLIRTQWKVADTLDRQAKEIKSSARDVKLLKSAIKEAIASLRARSNVG